SPAFCYCPSAGAAIIGDGEGNVTLYEYYRAKRILTPTTKFQAVSQGNLHLSSGNFYHITAANGEHMQHSAKSFFNVLNEPRNSALLGLTTATVYREGLPQQVTAFRLIKKLWVPSDERLGFKFGRPITRIVFIPE
ncbi:MAG TPA: hypothetical protein PLF29_01310, partial [bacterium]|nr:hypothetical protein [bacterium]